MAGPKSRTSDHLKSLIWLAREDAGLTREQVCQILEPGVSTKTLERWERGETPISHQRMRQLALVYRVKLRELVP
jgi:transcriptional regulator with XRE-family HTH domain